MSDLTLLLTAFALLIISVSNLISYIEQIKSTTLPPPRKRRKRKSVIYKFSNWLPLYKSRSNI